jgi:hypothetical protein
MSKKTRIKTNLTNNRMNNLTKPTSRFRQPWRLLSLALSLGAAFLFFSCDKETPNGDIPSGELLRINFVLGDAAYDSEETPARGYNAGPAGPERAVVNLFDDWYMYATLEADPVSPTRAATPLAENTTLRIIAYQENAVVSTAEYVVKDKKLEPVIFGRGISISAGKYRFVAYSYNTQEELPYAIDLEVSPNKDLMWGSTPETTISKNDEVIPIAMKHKFSQMPVKINTEAFNGTHNKIKEIASTVLFPGYKASLQVASGTLQPKTIAEQAFSNVWQGINTSEITSMPRPVYTAESPYTSIDIGPMRMDDDFRLESSIARFVKQLKPGVSYTLRAKIKQTNWASSNVYWDAGQNIMTFDIGKIVHDSPIHNKQGLFFKWGSLIGIAPGLDNHSPDFNPQTRTIYVPVSDISWITSTVYAEFTKNHFLGREWKDIPFVTDNIVSSDRTNQYLLGITNSATYQGDICKQISGQHGVPAGTWRMPTSKDFGDDLNTSWQYNKEWFADAPVNPAPMRSAEDGQNIIETGCHFHDIYFPASGYRNVTNGSLTALGAEHLYWTGSACDSPAEAYCVHHTQSLVRPVATISRGAALPVRCIRDN